MESRLFGLKMSKGSKRAILICIPLAIFSLVCYLVLGLFEIEKTVEVVYPSGQLSESIFDSQNLEYKSEEAYSVQNLFQNLPFSVDTVEGKKASIGNANIYQYEPYYFYLSEMKEKDSLIDTVKAEMTGVVSIAADPNKTQVEVLKEETGYVNGCKADYVLCKLTVSGNEVRTRYMCIYRLHVDESIFSSEWDILVGCMSQDGTSQGLSALQTLSLTGVETLRLDEEAKRNFE